MKPKPQQSEPPTQALSLPNVEDAHCPSQPAWEVEEHLAIATRAYELSSAHGSEDGGEREDWLRAESELHLYE